MYNVKKAFLQFKRILQLYILCILKDNKLYKNHNHIKIIYKLNVMKLIIRASFVHLLKMKFKC